MSTNNNKNNNTSTNNKKKVSVNKSKQPCQKKIKE